jgi:hypothetical protein
MLLGISMSLAYFPSKKKKRKEREELAGSCSIKLILAKEL